jgi:hypothetical protein
MYRGQRKGANNVQRIKKGEGTIVANEQRLKKKSSLFKE